MKELYYDFHIHSCLSPCGDNDMTPNNIVGMALLKELDVIALTDHNSCKNCPAILEAGKRQGLSVIPGMELCTEEEIHVVCLFPTLERAMAFDRYVEEHNPFFQNDVDAYGHQYQTDGEDNVILEYPQLLVTSSSIGIYEVSGLMQKFGGVAIPAHIDKASYSMLAVLGEIPPDTGFFCYEIAKPQRIDPLCAEQPVLQTAQIITDSDAHYLWDISERYYKLTAASEKPEDILEALKTPIS